MWENLAEHISVVVGLLIAVSGVAFSMVYKRIEHIDKKSNLALKGIDEVRSNYIDRFEKLTKEVNGGNTEILERIHALHVDVAENYQKKRKK